MTTPAARVQAFLDERSKSTNLDPESIIGFNLELLRVSDLRHLIEDYADAYDRGYDAAVADCRARHGEP